ncbi:hypothetical protein [Actinomadura harenae]|uniref:hypothetical protein n=1 Tax=Actinomadura harenae TaxID=2483351 RepID=UPI0011C45AF7|nr:hypothetical protein [Actinomadura harenae]
MTATGPHWRMVHRGRLAHCQREWACQVCGEPAPPRALLAVDADGRCLTSAPMHPRCAKQATAACSHLSASALLLRAVTRDQIVVSGDLHPDLGETEQWRVPPAQPGLVPPWPDPHSLEERR